METLDIRKDLSGVPQLEFCIAFISPATIFLSSHLTCVGLQQQHRINTKQAELKDECGWSKGVNFFTFEL